MSEADDDVVVFESRPDTGKFGLPEGEQEITITQYSTPEQLEAAWEYVAARNRELGLPIPPKPGA